MSDSVRCRATAAHYATLAAMTSSAEVRRAYLELQQLWLEAATWTDRLHLQDNESARRRVYELIDQSGSQVREIRMRMQ
jgi:hypothetical protein